VEPKPLKNMLKHTVLYAEDDKDDVLLLQEVFKKYEDTVDLVTFPNGLELLSYLNKLSDHDAGPCLVILDINMPLLNGKETLAKIRDIPRYKNVPVIMFTTSSNEWDRQFAFKYNAGFFTKPINSTQLDNVASIFLNECTEDVKRQITRKI
jgi:CheY-like chemotaxis protein